MQQGSLYSPHQLHQTAAQVLKQMDFILSGTYSSAPIYTNYTQPMALNNQMQPPTESKSDYVVPIDEEDTQHHIADEPNGQVQLSLSTGPDENALQAQLERSQTQLRLQASKYDQVQTLITVLKSRMDEAETGYIQQQCTVQKIQTELSNAKHRAAMAEDAAEQLQNQLKSQREFYEQLISQRGKKIEDMKRASQILSVVETQQQIEIQPKQVKSYSNTNAKRVIECEEENEALRRQLRELHAERTVSAIEFAKMQHECRSAQKKHTKPQLPRPGSITKVAEEVSIVTPEPQCELVDGCTMTGGDPAVEEVRALNAVVERMAQEKQLLAENATIANRKLSSAAAESTKFRSENDYLASINRSIQAELDDNTALLKKVELKNKILEFKFAEAIDGVDELQSYCGELVDEITLLRQQTVNQMHDFNDLIMNVETTAIDIINSALQKIFGDTYNDISNMKVYHDKQIDEYQKKLTTESLLNIRSQEIAECMEKQCSELEFENQQLKSELSENNQHTAILTAEIEELKHKSSSNIKDLLETIEAQQSQINQFLQENGRLNDIIQTRIRPDRPSQGEKMQ